MFPIRLCTTYLPDRYHGLRLQLLSAYNLKPSHSSAHVVAMQFVGSTGFKFCPTQLTTLASYKNRTM